ncbi:hypothetical protein PT287_08250 [Lactobacillus sp. ESL0679]|nr:hypothetical protein [Lactobacillus sp. ESL0679]MDF7683488.1 hypothetical protein [Lactobacillus sp. ESL0679]
MSKCLGEVLTDGTLDRMTKSERKEFWTSYNDLVSFANRLVEERKDND